MYIHIFIHTLNITDIYIHTYIHYICIYAYTYMGHIHYKGKTDGYTCQLYRPTTTTHQRSKMQIPVDVSPNSTLQKRIVDIKYPRGLIHTRVLICRVCVLQM